MAFAQHHGTKRPTSPASFFYADSNTIFDAGSGPAAALRFGMRLATCLQSTRCLTDLLNKVADDEVQLPEDNVEAGDVTSESLMRPKRAAAREGQILRRLREKYDG